MEGGKLLCNTPEQVAAGNLVSRGNIPSGNRCAGFNDNNSCASGDCRVMTTAAGFGSWCYEPGLDSKAYTNTPISPAPVNNGGVPQDQAGAGSSEVENPFIYSENVVRIENDSQ